MVSLIPEGINGYSVKSHLTTTPKLRTTRYYDHNLSVQNMFQH